MSNVETIARNVIVRPAAGPEELMIRISQAIAEQFECHFILGQQNLAHLSVYQTTYPSSHETPLQNRVQNVAARSKPL